MPELRCAKRDAEKMRDWFKAAGFEQIYLFTDDSPDINDANQPYASQPTFATLKRFFRVRFKPDTFKVEDNLWFFFSGHGLRHEGKDYLMPSDGDPPLTDSISDCAIEFLRLIGSMASQKSNTLTDLLNQTRSDIVSCYLNKQLLRILKLIRNKL
jgi:uncharacterized caspase-like protein